jgi:hypothetical protein
MQDFYKDYVGKLKEIAKRDGIEVAKAALTDSSLSGTYAIGRDYEDMFWSKVVNYSTMLKLMGIRYTSRGYVYSNELTLGSNGEDVLRPTVAGTDVGDTVTLGDSERTFRCETMKGIVMISDELLEDNLEGEGLEQTLLGMIYNAFANELDHAILNGSIVGTSNASRGSVVGCWDGILEQVNDGGNIVYATSYSTRYAHLPGASSYSAADNKHLAALKALPEKYQQSMDQMVWLSPRGIIYDAMDILANKATALGDTKTINGITAPCQYGGVPFIPVGKMRTNHLVKATGVLGATTPGNTTINGTGVAKARATTMTVASIANFANAQICVVGATSSAGNAFQLHAETKAISGTPSGTTLTLSTALAYDHATGEYVQEFTTAPTATGCCNLLTSLDNLRMIVQRGMTVEIFREPRKAVTSHVFNFKGVPAVANPDNAVIIRDLRVV